MFRKKSLKILYIDIRYKLDFDSIDEWWCHTSFKVNHARAFNGDSIIGLYTFEQNMLDNHKLLVYKFNKKINENKIKLSYI